MGRRAVEEFNLFKSGAEKARTHKIFISISQQRRFAKPPGIGQIIFHGIPMKRKVLPMLEIDIVLIRRGDIVPGNHRHLFRFKIRAHVYSLY